MGLKVEIEASEYKRLKRVAFLIEWLEVQRLDYRLYARDKNGRRRNQLQIWWAGADGNWKLLGMTKAAQLC